MASTRSRTSSRHAGPPARPVKAPVVFGDPRPRLSSLPQTSGSAGKEATDLAAKAGLILDPWESWVLEQGLAEDDERTYLDPGFQPSPEYKRLTADITRLIDTATRAGRPELTIAEDRRLRKLLAMRDAIAGEDAKPMWAAFEVCLIVPRQNGKGAILEARELAGLFLFGEELIIHTAHEFKTCREAFRRLLMLIENCPDLDRRVARVSTSHGEEGIELDTGQRIRFLARSQSSGRGFSADLLVYDEAMVLDAAKVGATLPVLSARRNPQVWYTASAGWRVSTQLAMVRRRGLAGDSAGLCFMEYSADVHDEYCPPMCTEHLDPRDVAALKQANPALGIRISLEHCEREREGMDPAEFARERLCVGQYPAPADAWAVIPEKWWKNTLDPDSDTINMVHSGPVMAIALGGGRSSAAISVAGKREDELTQVEVIQHKHGIRWAIRRAVDLDGKYGPIGWVVDPHADEGSLADELEQQGLNVIRMTATDVAHAFGQFYDACKEGTLRHPEQPGVITALAGAEKRKLSEGSAWDRLGVQVDLAPLIADTFAHWGHLKYGRAADYDIGASVGYDPDYLPPPSEQASWRIPDPLARTAEAQAERKIKAWNMHAHGEIDDKELRQILLEGDARADPRPQIHSEFG
jgi:hypothetical protein